MAKIKVGGHEVEVRDLPSILIQQSYGSVAQGVMKYAKILSAAAECAARDSILDSRISNRCGLISSEAWLDAFASEFLISTGEVFVY